MSPVKYLAHRRTEKAAEKAVTSALRAFETAARNIVPAVRYVPEETLQTLGVALATATATGRPVVGLEEWLPRHDVEVLQALAALHLGPLVVGEAGTVLDGLEDAA